MEEQDLALEDELSRNPYTLKTWLNYLLVKKSASSLVRYVIYERALKFLPRSYKLWHAYLVERRAAVEHKCLNDKSLTNLVQTFERALIHLHKMPRIWLDFCSLLVHMKRGTETRHVFDRALQSLPVTQHKELWSLYLTWAKNFGVKETAFRVYRRFLMFDPSQRENFVAYLEEVGHYQEAAKQLTTALDDQHYVSSSGKSRHELWMHLCDLCANHAEQVAGVIKVEAIIRSGIAQFSDEVGRLWCRLADHYVRLGHFEKARDIYEEAIGAVATVRDFTIIFDAYTKVEESILTAKMQMMQDEEEENASGGGGGGVGGEAADVEMRLARLEFMMEKRPLLLNSVVLRQNPNNVHEWQKRIKMYKEEDKRKLLTYYEAIKAVDPQLANGRVSGLWIALARFYEKHEDLENARTVWSKATQVNFKSVDELASIWCAWGEMEMRHDNYEEALRVMQQAVLEPTSSIKRRKLKAAAQGKGGKDEDTRFEGAVTADRLFKNVKVWSLYLDLEESLGTVETCRAAYERVMDLKVITAQMSLNYATYLEEHDFFEDSFRIYERAVALFEFPQVKKIWLTYLDKFIARYEGTKLERLRDLFEQSITKVPAEDAAEFYLKYAKAEELYGLARHAMAVYDRATRVVPEVSRLDMYRLYIKKVEQHYGITKTRPAYERAISELNDDMAKALCIEYADVERKLGEVDRARAIYTHGSQFADPRREKGYWKKWREFEEAHGNEDTFREMLRVQRSVETAFSQVNYLAAEMVKADAHAAPTEPLSIEAMEILAEQDALDRAAARAGASKDMPGLAGGNKRKFVAASSSVIQKIDEQASKIKALQGGGANPDEIDIDDMDASETADNMVVKERPVPSAVYGSIANDVAN